jgi:hypothetical protein
VNPGGGIRPGVVSSSSRGAAPPASRREIRKASKSATPAERATLTFPAINAQFNWNNESWAETYLPHIRVAVLTLRRDDKELEKLMAHFAKDGVVPEMLEAYCLTKKHLEHLIELLDAALNRSFLVLERLGYSPDDPPPNVASRCH